MSLKKSNAAPIDIMIREDTVSCPHSLLIRAKDAAIPAECVFQISIIDKTQPSLPPHSLFIFIPTINMCQESVTHKLLVIAAINYFRQITKDHADDVKTINSLNTISFLCAIIRTIHFSSPMRVLHLVNGQTCEFCLIN